MKVYISIKCKFHPQFGMYANACGVAEWTYTGVKHFEKVCCNKGDYEDCKTNLA